MAWSLYNMMAADQVKALLDETEKDNASRVDFTPGLPREQVESAIHALLWAYGCRGSDTAFGYAMMNFWQAMRVDLFKSKIEWLPTQGIEASGEDDLSASSRSDESPVGQQADLPEHQSDTRS